MITTRAGLRPARHAWQAVLTELRKDDDRRIQLGKALWSVYELTERLVIEHIPCETTKCPTCRHIADALTIFYAVDALWANDRTDDTGGTT